MLVETLSIAAPSPAPLSQSSPVTTPPLPTVRRLTRLTAAWEPEMLFGHHALFLPTASGGRLSGDAMAEAGRGIPLVTGEILLLRAPFAGTLTWSGASGILVTLPDSLLRGAAAELGGPDRLGAGGGITRGRDPLVMHLIQALADATARGDRRAAAIDLGRALAHRVADVMLPAIAERTHRGGLTAWRMRRVEAFAVANLGRSIRLAELAAAAGLSPFHFSRAFKRSMGASPQDWMIRYRISRAQTLLTETAMPLTDIAIETGFCSHAHLTRTFRRVVGTTPSAWRAEQAASAGT
jgi:AraC-like DNA-binding protein